MEVILIKDHPAVGWTGDIVSVRNGYARNYLIPRGIAVLNSSRLGKQLEHWRAGIEAKKARLKVEAEKYAEQLRGEKLEFQLKIGAHGKSFGSIAQKEIFQKLVEKGHALERKQVRIGEPIRMAGEFQASVQLHRDVIVNVPIVVEGLVEKKEAEDHAGGKKRGRKKGARAAAEATEETSLSEGDSQTEVGDSETEVAFDDAPSFSEEEVSTES